MICAECYFYESGKCWSRRSGNYGCRMQPEGSCDRASEAEYTEGGIPWQTDEEDPDEPI